MSAPNSFEYSSQALPIIASALRVERKPLILDFASAIGQNISFFQAFSAKLFIEDLSSTIVEDFSASFPILLDKIAAYEGRHQFDLILFWDLLQYLPAADLESLLLCIGPLIKPSSHLLLMQSTAKKIPRSPSRFCIEGPDRVVMHKTSLEEIEGHSYTQSQLKRLLKGLQSKRSVLLRNGIQEVLFSFES